MHTRRTSDFNINNIVLMLHLLKYAKLIILFILLSYSINNNYLNLFINNKNSGEEE